MYWLQNADNELSTVSRETSQRDDDFDHFVNF